MAAQCDVNNIVAHFVSTGIDPYAERLAKQSFGYASAQSFEEALRLTAEVTSAFEVQPSEIRSEFSNDPALWLDSLVDADPSDDAIVSLTASEEAALSKNVEDPTITTKKEPETGEIDST